MQSKSIQCNLYQNSNWHIKAKRHSKLHIEPQISPDKAILNKMTRGGRTTLPDFKIYYKAVKSKELILQHTKQCDRVEWLEGNLHIHSKHGVNSRMGDNTCHAHIQQEVAVNLNEKTLKTEISENKT